MEMVNVVAEEGAVVEVTIIIMVLPAIPRPLLRLLLLLLLRSKCTGSSWRCLDGRLIAFHGHQKWH